MSIILLLDGDIIAYMKFDWNDRVRENVLSYTAAGFLIVMFWFLFHSWGPISSFLGNILSALVPFVVGFFLALVLIPLRDRAEHKWFAGFEWKDGTKRKAAVLVCMLVLALMVASFFVVLVPALVESVRTFAGSVESYLTTLGKLLDQLKISAENSVIIDNIYQSLQQAVRTWTNAISGNITKFVTNSVSFLSGIFDIFVALIITVYLLLESERFSMQMKKFFYALLPSSSADSLYEVIGLSRRTFNSFVYGKALDSLIIGIICAICTSLMRIPYAALISFVVGLTNMIPVFGPFIGAVPSIFILLIISPAKALEFAVFILILQQVDGNIIGPRILGDSLGLPALWIMFAIIVGGATFGIIGMFLGVPVFSVIYYLTSTRINRILRDKRIHVE